MALDVAFPRCPWGACRACCWVAFGFCPCDGGCGEALAAFVTPISRSHRLCCPRG
ncbi:hypothetical protein PF011_g10844 [Phytophthora fragariae]|uniref:Uncharacterized protein n=1 Tax=Phytophthora fragariae TaxID=53985 RepID=A0A6A3KQW0_9STRA|nr:hypothetical protein PF011_g10844 [Phytophthora fragariae]